MEVNAPERELSCVLKKPTLRAKADSPAPVSARAEGSPAPVPEVITLEDVPLTKRGRGRPVTTGLGKATEEAKAVRVREMRPWS